MVAGDSFEDDQLLAFARDQRTLSYVADELEAALAFGAVYDHVLTIDVEIEFVWKRPKWTLVQFLFLINRYLSDVILVYSAVSFANNFAAVANQVPVSFFRHSTINLVIFGNSQCQTPFPFIYFGSLFAYWAMQGIMIFRVSSIYNHDRQIILLLLVSFAFEIAVTLILQSFSDPRPRFYTAGSEFFSRCLPRSPWWSNFFWISPILFETLTLGLAILKATRVHSEIWAHIGLPRTQRRQSVLYILFRDSILFQSIILVVCFANLFVSIFTSFLGDQSIATFASFVTQIIGSRLVLNLREAYYKSFNEEYSSDHTFIKTPMRFVSESTETSGEP